MQLWSLFVAYLFTSIANSEKIYKNDETNTALMNFSVIASFWNVVWNKLFEIFTQVSFQIFVLTYYAMFDFLVNILFSIPLLHFIKVFDGNFRTCRIFLRIVSNFGICYIPSNTLSFTNNIIVYICKCPWLNVTADNPSH